MKTTKLQVTALSRFNGGAWKAGASWKSNVERSDCEEMRRLEISRRSGLCLAFVSKKANADGF